MNRNTRKNIFILVGVLVITGLSTHFAQAGFLDILLTPMDFFNAMAAMFFNLLLTVSSWLLSIAGFLLNISIQLTLRIKDFVDHAPGIYTTWKAIRDISGIFLIFFLLYAAIQMIIGLESPGWGKLIRNIVMAGILINFSFFFAGLGIDLSNVISLQLYNAIAPENSATSQSFGGTGSNGPSSTMGDGGIANIFMNSLKIPSVFNASQQASGSIKEANMNMGKIILIGVIGTIIMITSAFSFAAAALAFIARFVVLLFLLAFSPIWMLSIFPEVDKYVKMWKDAYKSMLIFMPVYLLLMYLAMNVLTTTPFFNQTAATNYVHWYDQFISLGINAALVIFLLNVPLVAAAAIAGKTGSVFDGVLNGAVKRFGAGTVWKGIGSQAGARTAGRLAYSANNSGALKAFTSKISPTLGGAVSSGLTTVSKAGFGQKKGGYEDRLKAKMESQKKMHERIGEIDKSKYNNDPEGLARAEEKAKKRQQNYRSNLPWRTSWKTLGLTGGIGFLVDNRGNRQSSFKLGGEAKKIEDKKAKEQGEKEQRNLINERKSLEEKSPIIVPGQLGEQIEQRKKDRIAQINTRLEELDDIIRKGKRVEDEENQKKILDKIEDIDKKVGSSGGGGSGESKEEK